MTSTSPGTTTPGAATSGTATLGTKAGVAAAADRLLEAARTGQACRPVRDLIDADDIDAAYAVQQQLAKVRTAAGARVVGHKVGLTSPAVQRQLGVDQPDFGLLFDDMDVSARPLVSLDGLLQPKIEAEIAFVLGADLDTADLTPERVRAAVAYAVPALEIVDSRIAGWDITIADTIADNASSGRFVLGSHRVRLGPVPPGEPGGGSGSGEPGGGSESGEFEPVGAVMAMTADGEVVSEGTGAACLGDPLAALAWLAGAARRHHRPLRAGQVVLSGALGPMVPVRAGMHVVATISGLGTVAAHFEPGNGAAS
jgi:2-keto-4-pentenoate hydratase